MRSSFSVIYAVVIGSATFAAFPALAAAGKAPVRLARTAAILRFSQVSVSSGYDCGVTEAGKVVCWGDNRGGASEVPSGDFVEVSAGGTGEDADGVGFTCAIKNGGSVICWGWGVNSPSGRFTKISAAVGADYACGIEVGGKIACWGKDGPSGPSSYRFIQVSTVGDLDGGTGYGCGVRRNGRPVCWGGGGGSGHGPPGPAPAGQFTQVAVGYNFEKEAFACGLKRDGAIVCWGNVPSGQVPTGSFTQISGTCALRPTGDVACWYGADGTITKFSPPGKLTQLSGANNSACGVEVGGGVVCWNINAGEMFAATVAFTHISVGGFHWPGSYTDVGVCGLGNHGSITCWGGDNSNGAPEPPAGSVTQISVYSGDGLSGCGVKPGGKLICWGHNDAGELTPPAGAFTQVSVGQIYSCGIEVGGKIACWGGLGKDKPPAGRFARVSVGIESACGLRTDGRLACWNAGNTTPPSGVFAQLRRWLELRLRGENRGPRRMLGKGQLGHDDTPFRAIHSG